MADKAKMAKLKEKFQELDTNGDGTLDFEELKSLLTKGNKGMKDGEVRQLYRACDTDHNGTIDFDEFLAYIYGQDHDANRTSGGRHDRMAKAGAASDDGTEGDWGACHAVFEAFAGKDMDGKEFAKFCKDNKLIGKGMAKTDVDLIFAKVVPKGKRRMEFAHFQDACRHIAVKRGQTNGEIQAIVGSSTGPNIQGTKQDAVRFYDDKTTFTGAHAHNDNFEGTDAASHVGRHERDLAAAEATRANVAGSSDEELWPAVQQVFEAFAGEGGELDGREFLKTCKEIHGLLGGGFTKNDVDMVFVAAAKHEGSPGNKKISFIGFKDAITRIAEKKKKPVAEVQNLVAQSDGPHLTGVTKTEYSRFHDDKSTYTGAHADVHGREGGHGSDKHAELHAKQQESLQAGIENEHPWEHCEDTYHQFGGDNMDSREFLKLMVDSDLFDKNFTKNDVDIVFTRAAGRGNRRLTFEQFQEAIRHVAQKKQCETYRVQQKIARAEVHLHGTKAEYSKFHDDHSTYTGAHAGK